jgi:periplasmic mercuric ion binding protein
MTRTFVLLAGLLLASAPAFADIRTVVIEVPTMTCATCPITVKKALSRVDGVTEATVSWEPREAVVRYDDSKSDIGTLLAATRDAGYPARVKEAIQ